ncbi:hypothetical protein Tco_1040065 [Tanacetum coccineum]
MSTLKFAETHNLVAFLEKPEESNGFEGIIHFLNASSIKYALTFNTTVYESCIQQFWAAAKAKTVNGECQIQALIDKKKVIITEKSVRSDLMLEDAEGTECLPNDVIFEQLTLMGDKTTAWNEFSSTMASAIIYLATNQNFNFSKYIFDNIMMNMEGGVKFLMYLRRKQRKDNGLIEPIPDEATNEEPISTPSCDPPQSGEDSLQLAELMTLCTKLQKVESSNDSLGTQEDASNQGSKIADLDADAEVTLIDETQENLMKRCCLMYKMIYKIKAAKPKAVTIVATKITTAVASTRPKAKGIVFHDQEKKTSAFTPIVSSLQSLQLPQIKDKGKGKMVESENPFKKKDQVALDEELALRLQAKEQAELKKKSCTRRS